MNFLSNFIIHRNYNTFMLCGCKMVGVGGRNTTVISALIAKMGNSFITLHLNTSKKLTMKFSIIYKISNVISNVISHIFVTPYICDSSSNIFHVQALI